MTKNQNSFGIGLKTLGISTEKGRVRIRKRENAQKVKSQTVDRVDQAVNQTRTSRPVRRGWGFK